MNYKNKIEMNSLNVKGKWDDVQQLINKTFELMIIKVRKLNNNWLYFHAEMHTIKKGKSDIWNPFFALLKCEHEMREWRLENFFFFFL